MFRKWLSSFIVLGLILFIVACQQTISFNVSFNSNGGSEVQSITYTEGEIFIISQHPTKAGFTFVGWFFDQDTFEVPLTSTSWVDQEIKDDVTLYAKWAYITYSLTYELNGGTNHPSHATSFTVDDAWTYQEPTRTGYLFDGWYANPSFTTPVTGLVQGTTQNITIYAKWAPIEYVITWKNYDGSILETDLVAHGTTPSYDGSLPVRPNSPTESFTFIGWTPIVNTATSDLIYVATYQGTPLNVKTPYDPTELNGIFGYDIYGSMPSFVTSDVILLDYSEGNFMEVYLDIFDWSEADADAYIDLLDATYLWDDIEESWILGNYYIYVYADDQTYPGKTVYGIGIYGEKSSEEDPQSPFDSSELNDLFGFDIYKLMPAITSSDALILDYSEGSFREVYVDFFDWDEADADAYIALLEASLAYDDDEESWILGDYFIYVYADDQSYPGKIVYGIGIYGEIVDPGYGDLSLYYAFNVQHTTTVLTTSYRENVDKHLQFGDSNGKVIVRASYLANITGTPPTGLTNGIIFASDVSNTPNALAYLEIDTLGNSIYQIVFDIEARDGFSTRLQGAKLQIYQSGSWVDLPGGDFYTQLSTDVVTITIAGINTSYFRLVFPGSGSTNNGGQFKISNVKLYQTVEPNLFASWSEMMDVLKVELNASSLSTIIPELETLTQIQLSHVGKQYIISGAYAHTDYQNRINLYLNEVFANGFVLNDELTALYLQNVYVYAINDDLAYALIVSADGERANLIVWAFDPVIEKIELSPLGARQTINQFEVSQFGQSGLPSTGSYNVLVIPVEINGVPFPSDYQTKLDLVFNGISSATGWESVSSFYQKSSYGILDINFVISNKYTTTNTKTYYENYSDEGDQYAIKEALLALDASINFADYDSNNDGHIDSVIFIYSVMYDYDVNPWWAWVYTAQYGEAANLKLDNKSFEYYFWASYHFVDDDLPYGNPAVNAETYIHELGHLMGLIDYYSFTYDYGPLGGFDMMDYNAGDHGPATKLLLGWLQPYVAVSGSYEVILESYAIDTDGIGSAIVIPYRSTDFDDGNAFDEFIIIMFYTPEGLYGAHLSAHYVPDDAGLVIYHVDARLYPGAGFWDGYFMYNNDGDSDFFIDILEVDKNNSMPGNNAFTLSDMLRTGSINLGSYQWHQGGSMNIAIDINQVITSTDDTVSFVLHIN